MIQQGLHQRSYESLNYLSALNGEIPGQLKRLVFQMLEKESDKRPESMDVVAEVLKSVSGKLVV
jgi:hypothetical protein